MMFDTLSKELYSLKTGIKQEVAEFGYALLQHVQILQSEYPGRIQLEHLEEQSSTRVLILNNGKCWLIKWMVSSQPATPTWLLATQKLERWAEVRNPLPLKMAVTKWIKCNAFSDARASISLAQAEGQLHSHCSNCDHWKCCGRREVWNQRGKKRQSLQLMRE